MIILSETMSLQAICGAVLVLASVLVTSLKK